MKVRMIAQVLVKFLLTFICSDPSAITAFFSMMITKPMSQFFVYDKATCKCRPCGQNLPAATGSFSFLSEISQMFHPFSEVRARAISLNMHLFLPDLVLQVLFLTPNVQVEGAKLDSLLQEHFLCPLFRAPSCGIDVHKHMPHAFNAESAPIRNPSREFSDGANLRTQPILYVLFPSTDPSVLQSSMAAAVMFQSKEPPKQAA